jgi:hypothetical protein
LVENLHLTSESVGQVVVEARISPELFDRLALWGVACQDCELSEVDEDGSDDMLGRP